MKTFASIPILLTALLFLALWCISCTTEKKATNYFNTHEIVAANYCAVKFPVKDSIVTRIDSFNKASNIDWTDSINGYVNALEAIADNARADSIRATTDLKTCQEVVNGQAQTILKLTIAAGRIKTIYKPCKPDTVIKITNHYIENTARVKTVELALDQMTGQRNKYVSRFQFWLKAGLAGWGLLLLLLLLIVLRARLPFKLF